MEIVEKIMVVRSAIDIEDVCKNLPTSICSRCRYWSGNPGNRSTDLVCAVAVPHPSRFELERVCGRVAYTFHDCRDFERDGDD